MAGKGAKNSYKDMTPEQRAAKLAYDKKYQATPSRVQYRSELNAANRKAGSKVGDGKDMSHTKSGKLVKESQKTNRARNGQNGRSTKK